MKKSPKQNCNNFFNRPQTAIGQPYWGIHKQELREEVDLDEILMVKNGLRPANYQEIKGFQGKKTFAFVAKEQFRIKGLSIENDFQFKQKLNGVQKTPYELLQEKFREKKKSDYQNNRVDKLFDKILKSPQNQFNNSREINNPFFFPSQNQQQNQIVLNESSNQNNFQNQSFQNNNQSLEQFQQQEQQSRLQIQNNSQQNQQSNSQNQTNNPSNTQNQQTHFQQHSQSQIYLQPNLDYDEYYQNQRNKDAESTNLGISQTNLQIIQSKVNMNRPLSNSQARPNKRRLPFKTIKIDDNNLVNFKHNISNDNFYQDSQFNLTHSQSQTKINSTKKKQLYIKNCAFYNLVQKKSFDQIKIQTPQTSNNHKKNFSFNSKIPTKMKTAKYSDNKLQDWEIPLTIELKNMTPQNFVPIKSAEYFHQKIDFSAYKKNEKINSNFAQDEIIKEKEQRKQTLSNQFKKWPYEFSIQQKSKNKIDVKQILNNYIDQQ